MLVLAVMQKADPRFPVGKARLETIGVLVCAIIMSIASWEVRCEADLSLNRHLTDSLL